MSNYKTNSWKRNWIRLKWNFNKHRDKCKNKNKTNNKRTTKKSNRIKSYHHRKKSLPITLWKRKNLNLNNKTTKENRQMPNRLKNNQMTNNNIMRKMKKIILIITKISSNKKKIKSKFISKVKFQTPKRTHKLIDIERTSKPKNNNNLFM